MDDNDITLDVSLDEAVLQAITSTPVSTRTRVTGTGQLQPAALFKPPLPPPPPTHKRPAPAKRKQVATKVSSVAKRSRSKKPQLVCNDCGKVYVNMGYFKNHCRTHSIQAAYERYPDKVKIFNELDEIVKCTLKKVIASPAGGEVNETAQYCLDNLGDDNFKLFTQKVCEVFTSAIVAKKFLLPSKLLDSLVRQCESIFSNTSLRTELDNYLMSMPKSVSSETSDFVLCEYVLCFSEELLRFIAHSIHEGGTSNRKQYECDEYDRKIIHYVSGATLRAFYKMSGKYPQSKLWKRVKETIAHRVVNSEVDVASAEDRSWTEARSRGKLLSVNDTCLEFFVLLSQIIDACEEPDGSVSKMKVFESVVSSMAMTVYWDTLISDSLSEDESIIFLRSLVHLFCQTCGRGIIRRRINLIKERPEISMSLRHSVATRKVKR